MEFNSLRRITDVASFKHVIGANGDSEGSDQDLSNDLQTIVGVTCSNGVLNPNGMG